MIDTKIKTLLTLEQLGSYTQTAEALSLTQPAVSHHIRMLEEHYSRRAEDEIFLNNKYFQISLNKQRQAAAKTDMPAYPLLRTFSSGG